MKKLNLVICMLFGLFLFSQEQQKMKLDSIQIWNMYPDIEKIETVVQPEYFERRLDKLADVYNKQEFLVKYYWGPYSQVKIVRKRAKENNLMKI